MTKILQVSALLLISTLVKPEEVTNCLTYGTTTFCINSTNPTDANSRLSAQILRTSGTLHEADFPEMPSIKALEFLSNNLTAIEPKFFSKFPNLTRLIIRGNDKFPTITKELLKHCKNLVNLKIYFNYRLHHVDENILRNFPKLEKFVLRSERIHHLRKHDLEIVRNLRVLKLELTTIKLIEDNAFEPIGNLEKLSLMANNYLKIDTRIFNSVPKLTELNLVYAEIKDLSFLKKLPKLQFLQLGGNKIHNIFADTFEGLHDLQVLDLAHTGVSHIDTSESFFRNIPKLEKIDLTCHNLTGELQDIFKFYEHDIMVVDKYANNEDRHLAC